MTRCYCTIVLSKKKWLTWVSVFDKAASTFEEFSAPFPFATTSKQLFNNEIQE